MAEIKLVGGDVLISAEPEIEAILQAHTRAAWWLRRLVTDVLVPAAENPESGKWSFPNKMQVIHLADRFGKKLGEFVNRLDAWDDAKALFEVLALVILSNRDYELLTALASGLAMVYGQLSRKDRRLLAGIAGGKPVYRMVEIADQVSPQNMLLFTRLMRERLPHAFAGSEEAVGDAAIAAFNWVLRHSATLTLALTWPFFDEHTIDVFPKKIAGASVLLTPPAQSDVNEAMRDALARRRYVLPPTGVTVIPPENTARVERLVVWERGSWVVGCLKHGSGAGSLVLARPSMPACISLWTMMTEKGTPVSNDPLAALVADAYYDLVTVSEAKLARRSRRTEGEAREARRSERKGV
ncbi:MAG: hypothetical protein PWP58_1657 [Bacillota bacterium]|nr:hypothetical protein [Bacillota bacterium]